MAVLDDVEASDSSEKHEAVTSSSLDDEAFVAKRRIHYVEDDLDITPVNPGRSLTRRSSIQSISSLRSAMSANRTVDPSIALPIQYRTVSFNIEDAARQAQNKSKQAKDKISDELAERDWHILSEAEICKRLETNSSTGQSIAQVTEKQALFGKNVPSPPPSQFGQKLFGYFFGGFGSILFLGSVLVFISWKPLGNPAAQANLALAIVLIVVFFAQAFFNAWQDFSSSRVMKSITGMLPEDCLVLRDGLKHNIPASEVVPGDVLFINAGNKLPADVRFVNVSSDAKFDRSILTGESLPSAAVTETTNPNYLETRNIGMQGTHCTSGSGVGIVVSTGDHTVFGHIAKLTSMPSKARTPLQVEIIRFVIIIVCLMVTMNLVVIGVWAGYIRNTHPDYMPVGTLIVNIVSVAIAFVPEGLPIALTASLTITANIMRKNNILCKSLKTVETLGSVTVLLSDKTGTLTKNQMVVTDVLVGLKSIKTDEAKTCFDQDPICRSALNQIRIIAATCNAGEFDPTTTQLPLADRKIIADATDSALLRFSELLAPVNSARELWRKRFDLAFNSKNKFAMRVLSPHTIDATNTTLSVYEAETFSVDTDFLLAIKGAPDVLMPRCNRYIGEDGVAYSLEEDVRAATEHIKNQWSSEGKRVLLLARKVLKRSDMNCDPSDGEFEGEVLQKAQEGLILVGLVAIVDPPRDEVPHVIRTLRRAGIRTIMVTGDFKLTAQAIARACGIISCSDEQIDDVSRLPRLLNPSDEGVHHFKSSQAIVLSGPELMSLNDVQWQTLTHYKEIVFARTTPDQKLRIVKEFKKRDNVVAMTGDGVNDAPSLKEADVGIAPGSGSDIALEAADMILLDSFSAIVEAVLYGRTVFDNLKKTIAYLLPAGTFSEFWPVMTSVVFGLPQILSSFLMIIICCFTDCAVATVLAFEKPEADVLLRSPRNIKKDRLVNAKLLLQSYIFVGIIECVTSFSMSFWYLQRNGVPFSSLWFSYGNFSTPGGKSSEEITNLLSVASSIYFVNLVVMQWFNVMALRTRRLSVFQHPPLFNRATQNWYIFPAILFALLIIFIFCYVPGLQRVIGSTQVPVEHWFLPMAFGIVLLSLDEGRKACVRRWPGKFLDRIAW